MTTQTEAARLADLLDRNWEHSSELDMQAAAELRRLVSFNQQLMDEVARLNKAVADEREACAKVCESQPMRQDIDVREQCAAAIRARGTHD